MSIKRSAVKYWLHTCKWIISHVCISVFLLLGFLLVIIWWNLIVIVQNPPPLCLISFKTQGNGKERARDCFAFWAYLSAVWAAWQFLLLIELRRCFIEPRLPLQLTWGKLLPPVGAASHRCPGQISPAPRPGARHGCQYQALQRSISSCALWGLFVIIFKRC